VASAAEEQTTVQLTPVTLINVVNTSLGGWYLPDEQARRVMLTVRIPTMPHVPAKRSRAGRMRTQKVFRSAAMSAKVR
jgi:hypothetical protein